MAVCQRCRHRQAVPSLTFCEECAHQILADAMALGPSRASHWRQENATAFSRNGLTYASINGREVAPDILVTHASVAPAIAAELLARLRNEGTTERQPTTDLEWDPDD